MQRFRPAFLLFSAVLSLHADDSVSPAFSLDLRGTPAVGYFPYPLVVEVSDDSLRFHVDTVQRAPDTDQDGMPDAWESAMGLSPSAPDADQDPDGDGLTNLDEYNAGTHPLVADLPELSSSESATHLVDTRGAAPIGHLPIAEEVWGLSLAFLTDTVRRAPDTDRDGMPDDWEIHVGLNPMVFNAGLDSDGDGRTDLEEYNAGTHPLVADDWTLSEDVSGDAFKTDTRGADPVGGAGFGETFAIAGESGHFVCDTGGLYYDWDGDGIPNWWEARFSQSKTAFMAAEDSDADGMGNFEEFVAYTNPTNSQSLFSLQLEMRSTPKKTARRAGEIRIADVAGMTEETVALTFPTAVGRIYRVYTTTMLKDGWDPLPVSEIDGTGDVATVLVPADTSSRFFRVTVELQ